MSARELRDGEKTEALALAWKVFSEYETPVYSREGTEAFRKCLADRGYLNGIVYYGAFDGDRLAGFLGIRKETAHICFFFVDGDYQRQGVGTELFRVMKKDFRDRTLTLNSSPYGLPFYEKLGFKTIAPEQTVNGIRFTPMTMPGAGCDMKIVKLTERRDLKDAAAAWFSDKWKIPVEAYAESIEESFSAVVPSWYLCLDGSRIVAGTGVIENDFHDRKDLRPNVCAVFTDPEYRGRGIAGKMLNRVCSDMAEHGIETLYLITDHTGFYERYGWKFHCMAQGDGDDKPSRIYMHETSSDATTPSARSSDPDSGRPNG